MVLKRNSFDFLTIINYAFTLLGFLIFNNIESQILPYSIALFVALMVNGAGVVSTPLLFLSSFLLSRRPDLLICAFVPAVIFFVVMLFYKKARSKPKLESLLYTIVSLIAFVIINNYSVQISLFKKIVVSLIIIALTLVLTISIKAITNKGLKFKFSFEENLCLTISLVFCGLGICNFLSPAVWKSLSVFILLLTVYLFKADTSAITCSALGISLAIYYQNLNFIAIFLVWNLCASSFKNLSRYLSALSIVGADYLVEFLFGVYGGYDLIEFLPVLIACALFCMLPNKPLKKLKEQLYSFRERQLVRHSINRNRLMLSNRLYELSNVFGEMACAFNLFKQARLTEDKAKDGITTQIIDSVCSNCANLNNCKKHQNSVAYNIGKMTDIGFAKGKLSFIDLSKELLDFCIHPNDILYAMNKLLAEYRSYKIQNDNLTSGRDLIASQSVGVSEILRGLALETGATLKYQSRLERTIADLLFKNGYLVSELLIYGESHFTNVCLILTMKEFSLEHLTSILSKAVNIPLSLKDKNDVSENKCYLSFAKSPDYDAVFGVARVTKDGSLVSGDTHAVTRISDDKFLLALSDGMGSGKHAENVSSAALSLIESFYKAGLSSNLILTTVNKLLSINTEDSFTALDVSVIDLNTCNADFIKYGSPYGFIVGDNGIRIIEGNSLPLGIIDDLKPSVCNAPLNDGDMIILVTDGISDAFSSSSEVIDYLRTVCAKNPQTLANSLLSHAVKLNGGHKKDDMTVLAVRVFKKAQGF